MLRFKKEEVGSQMCEYKKKDKVVKINIINTGCTQYK